MKKLVLAIILSLSMAGQCYAGYTVKPRVEKVTGTGQAYVGNINVKSINFFSSTAGDRIAVYNANIATGPVVDSELEFEVGISANNSSNPGPYLGVDGMNFGAGVYIASSSATAITSVLFDY